MLAASQLNVSFNGAYAVRDASLALERGERLGVIGESGCGKSMLGLALAGMTPDAARVSGKVVLHGRDMQGANERDWRAVRGRTVAMVFQEPMAALNPLLRIGDTIREPLQVHEGLTRAQANRRAFDLLAEVGIDDPAARLRQYPHQISGGQRQRVALARSLAKAPKLLLLDEPLGALDKKLREETQFELVKIQESLGVTFIVVTHDQEEAMTLATRIGVMNQGEIAMIGEPTDIYEYPNSRFVAGFIGSVNMVEGTVTEDEPDHVRIRSAELGCDIYVGHGVDCAPDQILWWAIRPEKMTISRDKPEGLNGANVTTGIVEEIAYLGDISLYQVALESGKRIRVSQTNSVRGNPDAITWDEKVYVTWGDNAGSVLTS